MARKTEWWAILYECGLRMSRLDLHGMVPSNPPDGRAGQWVSARKVARVLDHIMKEHNLSHHRIAELEVEKRNLIARLQHTERAKEHVVTALRETRKGLKEPKG